LKIAISFGDLPIKDADFPSFFSMFTRGYQKESLISQGVLRNDQLELELVNIPHYPGVLKDTDHGNMVLMAHRKFVDLPMKYGDFP